MMKLKTFESGMRLSTCKMPELHSVCIGIMINVGSAKETAKENGYSHLIEHMLFKGTITRTATQISEEMDAIGAMINAFTAKECTCFYAKCIDTDLEKCIDLLSDIFFNATFPEEELEREKQVVIEEIKMSADTPDDLSQDVICKAVFGDSGLGQTILGSAENIEYSDRHSILEFKNKHYIAPNTVVCVAGNFDETYVDELVAKYIESNFADKSLAPTTTPEQTYCASFEHNFTQGQQCHLEMAFPIGGLDNPDRYALDLLSAVLGGGMSSRLFKVIREENGLAYSVYSACNIMTKAGFLEIYCGTSPVYVKQVCQLLQQELGSVVQNGFTQAEFDRAKVQLINGFYMAFEGNLFVMRALGRNVLNYGKVLSAEEIVDKYRSVTLQDVIRVAKLYLKNGFASSYVGKECNDYELISQIDIK